MNNNTIKNSKSIRIAAALSFAAVAAIGTAYGGVPLNNLQGAGGIAFNPLAYTAGIEIAGDKPSIKSTSGFFCISKNWRA